MNQHDLETGVEIGDFRIECRLGAGGMGIVYRARQVSLDRMVALKILGSALSREADRMRFQREAQAIAKLNHPGIATVHFIGQDRHVCYMAMEFIDGLTLRKVIDRLASASDLALTIDLAVREDHADLALAPEQRFDRSTVDYPDGAPVPADGEPDSPEQRTLQAMKLAGSQSYLKRCCEVGIETAEAMAHAHERGVIHRDIKPENILIDRKGRVHLIDFGIARFLEDVTLTNTGALVGTPMYMSPEQVTGRLDLDHRTDVYSLGMVLYELLTLAPPIPAPTREGVLRQIVTKALPPASRRNPALPRSLEGVLHKATARDPDDRYSTAADLGADLRRWLDGKPVAAPPYRYRLDPREIKAERPAGIMFLAFGHFMVAALGAIAASWMVFMIILVSSATFRNTVQAQGLEKLPAEEFRNGFIGAFIVTTLSSACLAAIGFGLLAAYRWARWITIGISSLLAAWALVEMLREAYQGQVPVALGFELALLVVTVSMIAYLARRSVRNWFWLAAQLRAENRRVPGLPTRRVSRE
jgi:serine/threonine protein kinase